MILTIKAKECKQLADGRWQLMTDCESLKEALDAHSPNILIEYLNERWKPGIAPVKYSKKRGGAQ